MNRKSKERQQGFTIIELMISTVVFSLLLVGLLSSFVKISDMFYKGVSMSKTQEDARNIVQSITDDIQFYNGATTLTSINVDSGTTPPNGYFCIGNHRYNYQLGAQVNGSNYGLVRDSFSGGSCPNTAPDPNTSLQMLDVGMQLNALSVNCDSNSRRCSAKIHAIFYGGDPKGLFSSSCANNPACPNTSTYQAMPYLAPDAQCTGSIESTDLCTVVDYDSTVLK